MITDKLICKAQSLCPICLKKIDAEIFSQGENTYIKKSCLSHGLDGFTPF